MGVEQERIWWWAKDGCLDIGAWPSLWCDRVTGRMLDQYKERRPGERVCSTIFWLPPTPYLEVIGGYIRAAEKGVESLDISILRPAVLGYLPDRWISLVSLPLTHVQTCFPKIGDVFFGAEGAIRPCHSTVSPHPLLLQIEFVSAQPHSWVEPRHALALWGERSWHKPLHNGIQKQRSVNEVLIAFIKTLTKELKWQKLPFPLKIHMNSKKYINNRCGFHSFEGITWRCDVRVWKHHFADCFLWCCIRDETLYYFSFSWLALFPLFPIPVLPSKNKKISLLLLIFLHLVKISKSWEKQTCTF